MAGVQFSEELSRRLRLDIRRYGADAELSSAEIAEQILRSTNDREFDKLLNEHGGKVLRKTLVDMVGIENKKLGVKDKDSRQAVLGFVFLAAVVACWYFGWWQYVISYYIIFLFIIGSAVIGFVCFIHALKNLGWYLFGTRFDRPAPHSFGMLVAIGAAAWYCTYLMIGGVYEKVKPAAEWVESKFAPDSDVAAKVTVTGAPTSAGEASKKADPAPAPKSVAEASKKAAPAPGSKPIGDTSKMSADEYVRRMYPKNP